MRLEVAGSFDFAGPALRADPATLRMTEYFELTGRFLMTERFSGLAGRQVNRLT